MAWLRADQLRNRGSILSRGNKFISISKRPERLWDPHSPLFSGYRANRTGREIGHSPICSAEVNKEWSYASAFDMRSWNGHGYFTFCCGCLFGAGMIWYSWVGRVIGCCWTFGVRLLAGVGIFLCAPRYRNGVVVSLQFIGTERYFLE